jgi:hypothetical protein
MERKRTTRGSPDSVSFPRDGAGRSRIWTLRDLSLPWVFRTLAQKTRQRECLVQEEKSLGAEHGPK